MDAMGFYAQLDKADDDLKAVSGDLWEECYKLSGEIDDVREYNFSELVVEAEYMADEEKKKDFSEADNN